MKLPVENVVGNIWLQGDESEIAAVKVAGNDPDRAVRSAAFTFDDGATRTRARSTAKAAYTRGEFNVYGIEVSRGRCSAEHDRVQQ